MKLVPAWMRPLTTLSAALAVFSVAGCDDSGTTAAATDATASTGPDTSGSDTASPVACETDADCVSAAVVSCRKAVCGEDRTCGSAPVDDGTVCTTSNACLEGETCTAGVCAGGTTKAADCGTAVCGEDACGNSCGTCATGETCDAGACVAGAAECGDITFEGCCTAAGAVKYCNEGVLETLDCPSDGRTCGWASDDGFDCSDEASGDPSETFAYLCPGETCTETCGTRECGSVCGQACGTGCGDGEICSAEGTCEQHPCGGVTFFGCCNADGSVTYCDNDALVTVDCATDKPRSPTCGWVSDTAGYYCSSAETSDASGENPYLCGGETCTETCDTRACGSVCGQTCAGTCGDGQACDESSGTCIADPCGSLTEKGCCDGANIYWCSGITVYMATCAGEGTDKCGWEAGQDASESGYFCTDGEATDVTLPRSCDGYGFDKTTAVPFED